MVMISVNCKGTFKKWAEAISSDDDSCPSAMCPTSILFLDPGLALEDLVILANHRLSVGNLASGVQILDRRSIG